jgi:hypothetical protein
MITGVIAWVVGVVLVTSLWRPSSAEACGAVPRCSNAWVAPSGGDIPSDRFSITYYSEMQSDGGVVLPRLTRTFAGAVIDVPFDATALPDGRLQLTPREVQPSGASIVLETSELSPCFLDKLLSEAYRITPAQPLPSTLGTLKGEVGRARRRLPGPCDGEMVDVGFADLSVQLDASALPFASLFIYALEVDGQTVSTELPQYPKVKPWALQGGPVTILGVCGAPRGERRSYHPGDVGPGTHRVRIQATLDNQVYWTPAMELELPCGGSGQAPPLPADAGPPPSDAGLGMEDLTNVSDQSDGCQLTHARPWNGVVWVAFGFLFSIWRRRQRAGSS